MTTPEIELRLSNSRSCHKGRDRPELSDTSATRTGPVLPGPVVLETTVLE